MKLLIENYRYPVESVDPRLAGEMERSADGSTCFVRSVGYFYSPEVGDCVFALPKVILDNDSDNGSDTVVGRFTPSELIEIDKLAGSNRLKPHERRFLYEFPIWIYRAIAEFDRLDSLRPVGKRSGIVDRRECGELRGQCSESQATLVDIALSLIEFGRRNRNFLLFAVQTAHRGFNRIDWAKTTSRTQAIVTEGRPFYAQPVNKRREPDLDEELLVIFYSILRYLSRRYGFSCPTPPTAFDLLPDATMDSYVAGLGKARLQRIKHRYYSDRALQLWKLCHAFFDRKEQLAGQSGQCEHLLAGNFEIVFEAIVDQLISDRDIPSALRNQRDGKIVDHIYAYRSLITDSDIYYIGDSKYYKTGGSVEGHSEYKQYTYARNVIHYNIARRLEGRTDVPLYRDPLTDGYDVTPNFFLSAEIDSSLSFENPGLKPHRTKPHRLSKHFANRLFDRDTLWVAHYDVNFLHLLVAFASGDAGASGRFRTDFRLRIRQSLLELLEREYVFYRFDSTDSDEIERFVGRHFRVLSGKIFHRNGLLMLALERNAPDSPAILAGEIGSRFHECRLGKSD